MHDLIQSRLNLCAELANARKEAGLSQEALAKRLGIPREKLARLEAGTGSVELLTQVMSTIPMRILGVSKGSTLVEQMKNCRSLRGWSAERLARASNLDVRTVNAIEAGKGTVASLGRMLSALAPQARRQPVTRAIWDYDRSSHSNKDTRFTPEAFIADLTNAFGLISLDPCSHPLSQIRAERKIMPPECGLAAAWGPTGLVYVNPPFSTLSTWLTKANDEWSSGKIAKIAFLMPSDRLDLREFHQRSAAIATTLLLQERLRFASPDNPDGLHRAPFAMCLVIWGGSPEEIAAFRRARPSLVLHPQ